MNDDTDMFDDMLVTLALLVVAGTFAAGVFVGRHLSEEKERAESYMQKVAFCHLRMQQSAEVRYVWRQQYCGKGKWTDPVTREPIVGAQYEEVTK